jgi:hypothetical protein
MQVASDYFKDLKDTVGDSGSEAAQTVANYKSLPFFDSSDSLGSFMATVPKDLHNLPTG